jgi:RND family efflux transporter MFP subunit
MTLRSWKIVVAIFGVLMVLAAAYFVISRRDATQGAPSKPGRAGQAAGPVAVEVAAVRRGTIEERHIFTGTLQAGARFNLSSQIAGRVAALKADLGDRVARGQLVARLDDDKYRFEAAQARAELEVAQANLVEAKSTLETRRREFERVRYLREQRVASEAELDSSQAAYAAQQARVSVAEAQVTQRHAALMGAQLTLSYTEIRATWQGEDRYRIIGERLVDEGTHIAANTPIFSIVRIDRLIAVAHAAERDYPRLSVGQAVTVTADALTGRAFKGRLARLAPVVRETSRQAQMEIEVDNREQILKPGMFVRLEIELARNDNALIVPRIALLERSGRRGLYVADIQNQVARYADVELGVQDRDHVEIKSPALEGYVVTLGQHLLKDGSPILVPERDAAKRSEAPAPSRTAP